MSLLSQLQPKKVSAVKKAIARHDAFISAYLERLAAGPDRAERSVTIIARSPASPVMRAVVARSEDLKRAGISLKVILGELGGENALAECAAALAGLHMGEEAKESFRWARNACLMDAHEQIILGTSMCWSGDCMRREPGKVDALDLFEADAPKVVRLGTLAFDAIWAISEQVPQSRLRVANTRPSASYAAGNEGRLSAFSFMRKGERTSPIAH